MLLWYWVKPGYPPPRSSHKKIRYSGIGLNLDIPPDHLPKVGLSPGPYKKIWLRNTNFKKICYSGIGLNLDIPPDHLPQVGLSPGPYKKNLVKFESELGILRKFVTLVLS